MNAEWDEECSVQQCQSNAELWWSRWAEEKEVMSGTVDGAWIPDVEARKQWRSHCHVGRGRKSNVKKL